MVMLVAHTIASIITKIQCVTARKDFFSILIIEHVWHMEVQLVQTCALSITSVVNNGKCEVALGSRS